MWVPDADHEALRDLVRAREDARQDQQRARHRLSKFLLRPGRRPPAGAKKSCKRQQGLDQDIRDIAWKAQWRLHTRYKKLAAAGKNKPQIVTAVGRELLGFIWAIAVRTEARVSSAAAA